MIKDKRLGEYTPAEKAEMEERYKKYHHLDKLGRQIKARRIAQMHLKIGEEYLFIRLNPMHKSPGDIDEMSFGKFLGFRKIVCTHLVTSEALQYNNTECFDGVERQSGAIGQPVLLVRYNGRTEEDPMESKADLFVPFPRDKLVQLYQSSGLAEYVGSIDRTFNPSEHKRFEDILKKGKAQGFSSEEELRQFYETKRKVISDLGQVDKFLTSLEAAL